MNSEVQINIETPILGGGVPSGGNAGQVLTKRSAQEGDYGWDDVRIPDEVMNLIYAGL